MRFKRRWWLLVFGFVIGLLVVVVLFRQDVGRLVLKRTLVALSKGINGEITYGNISGDIFSTPQVSDLRIVLNSDSILIRRLGVRYDILSLIRGKIVLRDVQLDSARAYFSGVRTEVGGVQPVKRWSFPDITVRQLAVKGGAVYIKDEKRVDSLRINLRLRARKSVAVLNLDSMQFLMVEESLALRHIGARVELSGDSLKMSEVQAMSRGSRFRGSLGIDLRSKEVTAEVTELSVNLTEILHIPGRVWFQGEAQLGEKRKVAAGRWVADGLLWRRVNLPRLTGGFNLQDSKFRLTLAGSDREIGRFALDGWVDLRGFDFAASIQVDSLAVSRLEPALPDFRLSAQFQSSGVLGSLTYLLGAKRDSSRTDSINLFVKGKVTELGIDTLNAVVDYRQGGVQLRSLTLRGPAGNFDFTGVARAGLLKARCDMENFDLSVAGRLFNVELSGRADGELSAFWEKDSWGFSGVVYFEGFRGSKVEITNGLIAADVNGSGPLRGNFVDRMAGRLAVGGEGIVVANQEWNAGQLVWTGPDFEVRFEREKVRCGALGELHFQGRAVVCSLNMLEYATEKETLTLLEPCRVVLSDSVVDLTGVKMAVADGEINLNARIATPRSPWFEIGLRHINLRKLQRLLGINTELWGVCDIDVVGGDSVFVKFTGVDFGVPSLSLNLKHIQGSLVAGREGCHLEGLEFVCRQDTSYIKGDFDWKLRPGFRLTGARLDFSLVDPGNWIFDVTKPYVEITQGVVFGAVKVNWRPESLLLSGRSRVSKGVIRVPSVATTVDGVEAEITFNEDRLVIEKLSGKSARGTVTAEGVVDLSPSGAIDSVAFKTHFTGVSAVPMPQVYAIGKGDINIVWHQGEERAFISGNTGVDEALVAIGFGNQQGGGGGAAGVDYDIRVRADRGVWLRNREADIELAVDLTVRQVGEEAVYIGELVTRQGNVYYLDHILRVTEGRLTFDNVSRFDPKLDITAELPITHNGKKEQPDKVVLSLTGTLSEPSFVFRTEPPVWDDTQVLSYLSLNVTMDEISVMEQKEILNRLLSERLLGYFQTQVAKKVREFVSLDYLELETGILSGQGARVTVGKYVGRNLYVSYTQNFSGELSPAFLIEYYLNRRNELIAERSSDGRYSLRYRFKLRY